MKIFRIGLMLMLAGFLVAGCSHDADMTAPGNQSAYDKDGTETLGVPSIAIMAGSGFVEGGVGMVGKVTGNLDITVPAGATVVQTLLYWEGGTTGAPGDDTIKIDGADVTGTLIGGPTNFFSNYWFSAFRADITGMDLVVAGPNSFTISDFDFDYSGGTLDEDNGVSMVVIYDDGTTAELAIRDGLDMAYFNFAPTLDATVPQTFTFAAEASDRTADLLVMAGSVGVGRPNQIKVTTSAGDFVFDNPLGSEDDLLWDSLILEVNIPAGDTSLTVELISVDSLDPRGASMAWVGTGLSVPTTVVEPACLGDYVWEDLNMDGIQDEGEPGREGVTVFLMDCEGGELASTVTDVDGFYMFCELEPGDYNVKFMLPVGYEFSPQDVGGDDAVDSDADPATGMTVCTTLDPGEYDMTWDAGIYMPVQDGCTLTIGFWKNHAGFGPQADVLSQYLPITLGDEGGSKSLVVNDAAMAVAILKQKTYGKPSNGITKLYAQMLAAKLNVASGASDSDISDYLDDADAFLADYDYMDWDSLSDDMRDDVMMWHKSFDMYNNGDIGPGHCGDDSGTDEEVFK